MSIAHTNLSIATCSVNPALLSPALFGLYLQTRVEAGEAASVDELPEYDAYLVEQCRQQTRRMERRKAGLYHLLADPQSETVLAEVTP